MIMVSGERRTSARAAAIAIAAPHRRADSRDAEVGYRVRSRRLECKLSQTDLANLIGVTFQQVQKYEKGVNRIGAGRLQRIAEALSVPPSFFFGGGYKAGNTTKPTDKSEPSVFEMMQTSGSVRLVQAFHKMKGRKTRDLFVRLAEAIVEEQI